jgi:hypothetical protein
MSPLVGFHVLDVVLVLLEIGFKRLLFLLTVLQDFGGIFHREARLVNKLALKYGVDALKTGEHLSRRRGYGECSFGGFSTALGRGSNRGGATIGAEQSEENGAWCFE